MPSMYHYSLPHLIAGIWGAFIFLPVGLHYLALFLITGAVLTTLRSADRLKRIYASGLLWTTTLFIAWVTFIFILQDQIYPQTASHLWHSYRIALTLLILVSLSHTEALAACKGMALSLVLVLLWLAGYYLGIFPYTEFWAHLTHPTTNKSIAASILFSFAAVTTFAIGLRADRWIRLVAFFVWLLSVVIIIFVLGKRTAILGVVLGMVAIIIHMWREKPLRLFSGLAVILFTSISLYVFTPKLQANMTQGIRELHNALNGDFAIESWAIRVQLIEHTLDMILEKPFLGWGIGSWNNQWGMRAPEQITSMNMPHNDFLWMGAEAGFPGALAWLTLMLSACWAGWRIPNLWGRISFAVSVITLFSSLVNNGTRDATLAFPMLFVVGVTLAVARKRSL